MRCPLAEGLRKREPTETVRKVSTSAFGDVYFHQILRDSVEQFLVVVGKTAIKVFDLAGNEKLLMQLITHSIIYQQLAAQNRHKSSNNRGFHIRI